MIINESASRSIWITIEIFLAPSQIWTHRDRESPAISPLLYLQATTCRVCRITLDLFEFQ